jgi:opacity protein-like surface antigen
MIYYRLAKVMAIVSLIVFKFVPTADADPIQQTAQLRAGYWSPKSSSYKTGDGIDLAYSVRPIPYVEAEAAIGYYRANNKDLSTSRDFLSAVPMTLSVNAILPLPFISIRAGGGVGEYYTMDGALSSDAPPSSSAWSFGYHGNLGIEFPATSSLSLQLNYKYAVVNEGEEFKRLDIKHGGAFYYGGFAVNF